MAVIDGIRRPWGPVALLGLAVTGLSLRWLVGAMERWGASQFEAARDLPGDELVPGGQRYLGRLPGQFWRVRRVEPGQALVMERRPPDSPPSATWTFVVEPLPEDQSRLLDRHRGERSPGALGRASDALWTVGTLLMERGMLRGIKTRVENPASN